MSSGPSTHGFGERRTPATRLGVGVVHDLVTAIVTGSVAPGDPLPTEVELCEHFGVSRTVIRESVKRLDEKGLVTVAQGRGTRVTDPSEWNILDRVVLTAMIEHDEQLGILDELAVVRTLLEAEMAGRAASLRDDDQLVELRTAHDALVGAREDPDAFSLCDIAFHRRVMEISGERLSQGIASTLTIRARDHSRFYGKPGPDAPRLTIEEHQRILDAIAAGDAERAAAGMRDHITLAWERRRLPRG